MKQKINILISALSLATTLVVVIMLLLPESYLPNLFRSMVVQIGIGSLLLLIIGVFRYHGFAIISNTINSIIITLFVTAALEFPQYDKAEPFDIKVAHFNVLRSNNHHQEIIDKALSTNADIISFQETDTTWVLDLKENLATNYPYSRTIASDNSFFGLAVFSKHKLQNIRLEHYGHRPNITGILNKDGLRINFIASHTIPPVLSKFYHERNQHLRQIAKHVDSLQGPKLAFGDYNTTPWDRQLQLFRESSRLNDGRYGLCATYPSWLSPSMIPIDYIFHSDDFECTYFNTISIKSSDHYGIVGCYKLKQHTEPNYYTLNQQTDEHIN